ncbi:MAG: hypothetical protein ACO1TE_28580 [Prosthecobacter sp.]
MRNAGNLELTLPTALGRTYVLLQSATLDGGGSWAPVPGLTPQAGTGASHVFQVPISGGSKFFRVQVTAP